MAKLIIHVEKLQCNHKNRNIDMTKQNKTNRTLKGQKGKKGTSTQGNIHKACMHHLMRHGHIKWSCLPDVKPSRKGL